MHRLVVPLAGASRSPGTVVHVVWTSAHDGDHGVDVDAVVLGRRRRAVIGDRTCAWLRQVHGTEVCFVDDGDAAAALSGARADASVTASDDVALAVVTADCAPIAIWSDDGVVAAVHAGWRGLADGVVAAAVDAVRARSSHDAMLRAALGPCIGPECYEFGDDDLAILEERIGREVRSTTEQGRSALDLPRAVALHLGALSVSLDASPWSCTACGPSWFSWRARRDRARQAMYVWRTSA